MNIAFVRFKHTLQGGAERIIERIINSLAVSGEVRHIKIFCSSWEIRALEVLKGNKNIEVTLETVSGPTAGRYLRHSTYLRKVKSLLADDQTIDLVQAHERLVGCDIFRAGDGVHRAWLDRLSSDASVTRRLIYKIDPYHQLICRNELAIARDQRTTFVANSPLAKREIQNYLDVPDDRIAMIPNGVDIGFWSTIDRSSSAISRAKASLGVPSSSPCILFVGSGFYRKGLKQLIQAISLTDDLQLIVVGRDKNIEQYRLFAEQCATGRVFFLGGLDCVKPALSAADVFVLPSLYDSFSNAALESIAAGVPVIISKDTGLVDYIYTFGGGVVCDRDPDSILASINMVLSNQDFYAKQAKNLSLRFDQAAVTPQWIELYQRKLYEKKNT